MQYPQQQNRNSQNGNGGFLNSNRNFNTNFNNNSSNSNNNNNGNNNNSLSNVQTNIVSKSTSSASRGGYGNTLANSKRNSKNIVNQNQTAKKSLQQDFADQLSQLYELVKNNFFPTTSLIEIFPNWNSIQNSQINNQSIAESIMQIKKWNDFWDIVAKLYKSNNINDVRNAIPLHGSLSLNNLPSAQLKENYNNWIEHTIPVITTANDAFKKAMRIISDFGTLDDLLLLDSYFSIFSSPPVAFYKDKNDQTKYLGDFPTNYVTMNDSNEFGISSLKNQDFYDELSENNVEEFFVVPKYVFENDIFLDFIINAKQKKNQSLLNSLSKDMSGTTFSSFVAQKIGESYNFQEEDEEVMQQGQVYVKDDSQRETILEFKKSPITSVL